MKSPLRIAILGGAAATALCFASVAAASEASTTTTPDGAQVQRIMVVRDDEGGFGGGFGGDHGPGMGRRGGDPERIAKHLRDVLQLTPAQEPALQAFLGAVHRPHDGADHQGPDHQGPDHQGLAGEHMHEHGSMPADPAARKAEMDKRMAEMKTRMADKEKKRAEEAALTTPQRLDMMVKKMAEHTAKREAAMQAHVAAIKQFYAALTPAQQKAFDALHGGMGGGMGHGRGGRMMHIGMMDGPMPPLPPLPPIPPLAMRAPMPPAPPAPPLPPEPPLPNY